MGGRMVVWFLSILVLYFVIADGYVVKVNPPEENNSVEKPNNEIEVDTLDRLIHLHENWYNWSPIIPGETDSDTVCDTTSKGYKYFVSTQSCYKVHTERATWAVAEMTCIREGGQLAVINSRDEAQVLVRQYPSGFRVVHIAVIQIQDSWKTIDGITLSEAGYENWDDEEPNNITGDQYCGSMHPDGSLDDIACSDETAFICEKASRSPPQPASKTEPQSNLYTTTESESTSRRQETSTTDKTESVTEGNASYEEYTSTEHSSVTENTSVKNPNKCSTTDPGYIFFYTNSCYKVHKEPATWNDAEAACVREGGHLAVINSPDEAVFFIPRFDYPWSLFYLGFHLVDNSWVTVHGQSFSDIKLGGWRVERPTSDFGTQMCGAAYYDESFIAIPCNYRMPFICEKDPKSQPPGDAIGTQTNFNSTVTGDDRSNEQYSSKEKKPTSVGIHNICSTTDADYRFIEGTQFCYKVHKERATWNDAEAACVREGGHLAVINSPGQNELVFFVSVFPEDSNQVFLGIYLKQGSWVTVQGQTLAETGYEKWSKDRPNFTGDQYCGALFLDGTLNDVDCNTGHEFICQKNSIFIPDTEPIVQNKINFYLGTSKEQDSSNKQPSPVELYIECGSDTDYFTYLESAKSCYKAHREKATWDDAEATCVREGGHLAVINSQDEVDFFSGYLVDSQQVFLGFYLKKGSWLTIKGQTLAESGYENWNEGEPNNITGDQNCGSMYPDGTFDDIGCYSKLAFICEKNFIFKSLDTKTDDQNKRNSNSDEDTLEEEYGKEANDQGLITSLRAPRLNNSAPQECSTTATGYTFYESTRSCYKVHKTGATWNDAEATCVREGGHLAVINSQDEADIIMQLHNMLPRVTHIFIGFSYREQDSPTTSEMYEIRENGEWLTIDGQTLSEAGYENWTPGEPNNAGGREYCGTIYGNGKFDDKACYERFLFICEINPSSY